MLWCLYVCGVLICCQTNFPHGDNKVLLFCIVSYCINRCNSHGHHGSNRLELAALCAHSRGSNAFTLTLTSTQLQTRCCEEAPAQLLQSLDFLIFLILCIWGRGGKPEYPEKKPDSLPANRYHIRGENPTSRTGIEPSPSNTGEKLIWPRVLYVPAAATPACKPRHFTSVVFFDVCLCGNTGI